MNRINKILILVLVVQAALIAARVFWPEDESTASGEALLTDFDPAAITQLRVVDAAREEVTLTKDGENWVLPEHGNYPVESMTVTMLLDKIAALTTDRLITRSTTSHRRLKVSSDEFERKIELQAGDTTHTLYLGTSSGGNTIHARLDDQDPVYLMSDLSAQDASTRPSAWINTLYFSVPVDQVISLRLQNANGEFEFTKEGDTWTMVGLDADETLNQNNLSTMLNQVTSFRLSEPLGTEPQDDFGLETPQATITIRALVPEETSETTSEDPLVPLLTPSSSPAPSATPLMVEKEYTLQIGAEREDGVVAKSSESEYYVLITTTSATNFTAKTRADFITVPPTPTPGPTLVPGTEEPLLSTPAPTLDAAATAEPEAITTPEVADTAEPEEMVTPEATEDTSDS